jgi:large subunit ribosomal protein L18e
MVASKTVIGRRIPRKTDSYISETAMVAKNQEAWRSIAQAVSGSRRNYSSVNLDRINKESENGETIIIPGKVLGNGELNKKIKICALYFSSSAVHKIKNAKSEMVKLIEEIKTNPSAKGVKIIR